MKETYHHYHTPPPRVSIRVRCPACHEEVYSRAGIHPQCAARESDPHKVKKQGQKSPSVVEPVSAPAEAVVAAVILEPPAPMRIFDPKRVPA
jgi:hypothetical protein